MATPEEQAAAAIIADEEIIDLEQQVDEVVPEELSKDPEELQAELAKERKARIQLTARAKKAEAENKTLKTPKEQVVVTKKPDEVQPSQTLVDVDERIMLSQGEDPEFLKELKEIATLKKVSLIEAKDSDLGVAAKKIFDDKKKSTAAAMGASRGSGTKKPEITLATPGLTEEQHRKLASDALIGK